MANQTIGKNVQDRNPYTFTVTNSGTLIGSDVELVYNQATVLTRQDLLTIVEQFVLILQENGPIVGFGPP